jgi:hypothetical protein
MERMFEFLTQVASNTAANKATQPESRVALTSCVNRLRLERALLLATYSSDEDCERIWTLLGLAYEVGKLSGFLDKEALKPAKYIRGWINQQKSTEAKSAKARSWQQVALARAIKARKTNGSLTQRELAQHLELKSGWPSGVAPSQGLLMKAIRDWEKSGELPRRNRIS